MKIDKVKEKIKEYQAHVEAYENYQPQNIKEEAIKLYAELMNVGEVAKELNRMGYRIDSKDFFGKDRGTTRKLISNDISAMIDTKAEEGDKLHGIIRKILNKNRSKL